MNKSTAQYDNKTKEHMQQCQHSTACTKNVITKLKFTLRNSFVIFFELILSKKQICFRLRAPVVQVVLIQLNIMNAHIIFFFQFHKTSNKSCSNKSKKICFFRQIQKKTVLRLAFRSTKTCKLFYIRQNHKRKLKQTKETYTKAVVLVHYVLSRSRQFIRKNTRQCF